jgi:beta-lactamase class A
MTATTSRLLRDVAAELDAAGLRGWFLVRDLGTGEEVGIDPDVRVPLASVVKVPLAMAVLERVASGALSEDTLLRLEPGNSDAIGPVGVTKFRHPAQVALSDVVYLSTSLSDSVAADALFDLVSPKEVTRYLERVGVEGLVVRHVMADPAAPPAEALVETPELAQTLATRGGTPGGGHLVRQLDRAHANVGSARACVDLLARLWSRPSPVDDDVAARVRALMRDNVSRNRLWPDFASDASSWSSKTGTLLNLRHEIGVVEHRDGDRFAVAALTESRVPAGVQPVADATMARVARRLRDHLRR